MKQHGITMYNLIKYATDCLDEAFTKKPKTWAFRFWYTRGLQLMAEAVFLYGVPKYQQQRLILDLMKRFNITQNDKGEFTESLAER